MRTDFHARDQPQRRHLLRRKPIHNNKFFLKLWR